MSRFEKVFVFADKPDAMAELCAGGKELGEQVAALVYNKETEDKAMACGADLIYRMGEADACMVEDYTDTMLGIINREKPGLVLIKANKRGKLMAGRLGAALKTSVLSDVMAFVTEGELFQTRRLVYGGAAVRTEQSASPTVIAMAGAGTFHAAPAEDISIGTVVEVDFISPNHSIKCIDKKVKKGTGIDLTAAKKVVGVGRGFAAQEDLSMAKELAELLGAVIGCTRPVAEGEHWLPKESYIGVSGAMLKPDLYLAIGISGQIQHMIGINQAQTVIAVNENKAAPIFKQADYGVIGDLYKIIPALIEKLKNGK